MAELTEGMRAGEYVASEANGDRSREVVTIDSSAVTTGDTIAAGTVLGKITKGAATIEAFAGNAADTGAIAEATVGAGAKAGDYKVVIIEPGTNLGDFIVEDPDGITVGTGVVATEFVGGGLTFTVTDGTTDFIAGEGFTITVAAGSGAYVPYDQDGTDGSEIASGILYDNMVSDGADQEAVAHVRDMVANGNDLTWPSDITDNEKTAAIAQLAELGIIVRT